MVCCGGERSKEKLAGMFADGGFGMGRVTLPGAQAVSETVAV